jgi:hypothetical protein
MRVESVAWTWSLREYKFDVPAEAVPFIGGAVDDACPRTKAVVAIWVVLVPAPAVGAVGVPVRLGDAIGALESNPDSMLESRDETDVWVSGLL